jgi:hypothetical protein
MKTRKLIRGLMEKWTYRLGLRWWSVDIYYYKGKRARKYFNAGENETVLARTFADWRYATANIHINLPAFDGMTDTEIERTVVHELCHILVNEMREGELHHEERTVTWLTKAFFWTAQGVSDES